MRSKFLTAIFAAAVVGLSGCSVIGTKAADKVADAVDEYCTREPYNARQLYRETINAQLAAPGHSVAVTCAGDPE